MGRAHTGHWHERQMMKGHKPSKTQKCPPDSFPRPPEHCQWCRASLYCKTVCKTTPPQRRYLSIPTWPKYVLICWTPRFVGASRLRAPGEGQWARPCWDPWSGDIFCFIYLCHSLSPLCFFYISFFLSYSHLVLNKILTIDFGIWFRVHLNWQRHLSNNVNNWVITNRQHGLFWGISYMTKCLSLSLQWLRALLLVLFKCQYSSSLKTYGNSFLPFLLVLHR